MAEIVVSAHLVSAVGVLIRKLASPEILAFFKRRKLNAVSLGELKVQIELVNRVVADAEEKQFTVVYVKNWFADVKDVVYEAEDLLDEIDYEVCRSEMEAHDFQTGEDQVRKIFSLNSLNKRKKGKLLGSLDKCLERLRRLNSDAVTLSLFERASTSRPPSMLEDLSLDRSPYGMENARAEIMKMIQSDAEIEHLEVISIVGIGGIGKTTLAWLIYNDVLTARWFDMAAWVDVGDEVDVLKLTKQILRTCGALDSDYMTVDELRSQLQHILMGKKFFLVLDDVWSEDRKAWSFFLEILRNAARSCKIIITTRSRQVAQSVGATCFQLKGIDDDACWQLFSDIALADEDWNARSQFEERFRQKIVSTCSGSPLAAKVLGNLLSYVTDAGKWEEILNSDVGHLQNDSVSSALALSYHNLSSDLKRCFLFCAIFPKDYSFEKDELILLWIAEGFLAPLGENKDLKEVGNQCFQELESMSFFQQPSKRSQSFMMPDGIHELAEFVFEELPFRLDEIDSYMSSSKTHFPSKTRHLSCASTRYEDLKNVEGINEFQNLRTFITTSKERSNGGFKNGEVQNILPRFKRLRVLSLSNISELPDSIGDLKHLRYLNLSETSIKRLPELVSALYHLQILILCRCRDLVKLPNSMMKLTSLCHLDIHETRLQDMPQQIGKLTKLQTLTDFFVGKQKGSGIKELGKLKCVQGKLCVWNLQNVGVQDASEANLQGMEKLKELSLSWSGDADGSLYEAEILEYLQPPTDLEVLAIVGYRGMKLSDWVSKSSLSSIITLRLSKCKYCRFLPPLGQLPSLKSLLVEAFDAVEVVGSEFYGGPSFNQVPFKSLESLTFESMPQWHKWTVPVGGADAFPLLQVLCIRKCPDLRRIDLPTYRAINKITLREDFHKVQLEKLFSGLYNLTVDSFHSLDSVLEEIKLWNCFPKLVQIFDIIHSSVEHFPLALFSKLKQLDISRCPNLKSLCEKEEPLGESTPTTSLKIFESSALESLALSNCSSLESVHCCFPSLVNLKIAYCRKLGSFPGVFLPPSSPEVALSKLKSLQIPEEALSNLKSLHIHGCDKLFTGIKKWDLQRFHFLSSFSLGDCIQVDSFPEKEMLLPSKLTSLSLYRLTNMTSLNHEGLRHLTRLQNLEMEACPELQSMPEGGLPGSLASLSLKGCPLLEKRCRREGGEDWPKICAIPNVTVSGDSSSYYN